MKRMINKVVIPFLVLLLALSVFLMCGTTEDPTSGSGDAGDSGSVQYTLTISKIGNGSTTPAVGTSTHDHGAPVSLTATADPHWHFVRWDGDVDDVNSSSTSVTMISDKTVTAVFEIDTHTLTISKTGNGSVTPTVGGHTYDHGTSVNLTATADANWHFVRWEGDVDNATSSSTSITMTSDKIVTAVFEIDTHTLTISKTGNGSVTPTVGGHSYDHGMSVDLTATADNGWGFVRWEGDAVDNATSSSTSITMTSDKAVTAVFEVVYTLTVNTMGGNVVISPESSAGLPNGIYFTGTLVTLTADEIEDFNEFSGWSGDITSTDNEVTITMDKNKTATASFNVIPEKLNMVSVTGGTYNQQGFSHTISDFSIGKYEVTYELWYAVHEWAVGHGYHFANAGIEGIDGAAGASPTSSKYHPVTTINWRDCIVWCNAYSEMMGLTPVYKSGGAVLKDSLDGNSQNCDNATCDWSANGYRLPTEGEWQFAASNGGNTPSNYASGATANYNNASACKKVAWYSANSGSDTHPVGCKTANGLGLHDMSGNVYEWCWDGYGSYPSGPKTDYHGAASGSVRVDRGGCWQHYAGHLQVGSRFGSSPNYVCNDIGFRLVRVP